MLPQAFISRLKTQDYIDSESLIKALEEPAIASVRINPRKWNRTAGGSEPVPWTNTGIYLWERPSFTLDPLFHAGIYFPQEASSMFLEEIFRQTVDDNKYLKVLDLCGAPGGKSTHLSSLIGNKGFLVANEVIRQRASILAENLTKWGLSNTIVTRNDPVSFQNLPGFFDVILVDAPCSGEGMFRDPIAINEWSEENASFCSERQKRILIDIWPALRKDGILIYSTCTFNPQENEKNVSWLIRNNDAQTIKLDIEKYPGITEINSDGIYGYGFHPGKIKGDGLFYSVIRKKSNEFTDNKKIRIRTDLGATNVQMKIAGDWTMFKEDSFLDISGSIVSIPCSQENFSLLSKHLFIIKPGTKILSLKGKDALPSHELALSVFLKEDAFPSAGLSFDEALNFLRKNSLSLPGLPEGWIIATYEGVNIGFMKNIGNRINNYYPIEWRIRMQDNGNEVIKWI